MRNVFEHLPDYLQQSLKRLNIFTPTPIQARAIGPALKGQDVLGSAQTGTGKTFAFLLPMLVWLEQSSQNALILSPTRELAQQIFQELNRLMDEEHFLNTALVIGGDNIHKQYAALRKKPRVIIATPGRLMDHIGRKSVSLQNTHFLVLDETDRMLDMGFIEDMRRIVSLLPTPRQTLLFSATLPKEILTLAHEFLQNPVRVQIGNVTQTASAVLQEFVQVDIREKLPQLLHELNTRSGSILVFVKTKHGAERLAKELKKYGQKASALHGELRQNRRRQVLDFFRNGTLRILVATDLAARGLDVAHIAHVINYDLPQSPEDYIHRIGRTGRAGSAGNAISFVVEKEKWKEICRVTQFAVPVKEVQKTIEPLPEPKFVAVEESAVRKKKIKKSPYTQRAKELLRDGVVSLPQEQEVRKSFNSQKVVKKPKTFHKTADVARLIELPETTQNLPFKKLTVGASKKMLKAQAEEKKKNSSSHKKKFLFHKHFKRKRR